jgi:multimeric flavodoxin WrbA
VIDGPDQYDFVFVGFPTWDMKLPPPMKSVLHQYSFPGKDNHPVQLQWRIRPREHLSERA